MTVRSNLSRYVLGGTLALSMLLGVSSGTLAQDDATPEASPAVAPEPTPEPIKQTITLLGADDSVVGVAQIIDSNGEVRITIANGSESGLAPGDHAVQILGVGSCIPGGETPFETAGSAFNPTGGVHGAADDAASQAGDLGNLTIKDDGKYLLQVTTDRVTLAPGTENSLNDEDGSSIVIYASPDDMTSDPSTDGSERIACGVIFPSQTPIEAPASPEASPEASPVS